jgi:hypothetical protein
MTIKEMLFAELLRQWAMLFQASSNPVHRELAERTFDALRASEGKRDEV